MSRTYEGLEIPEPGTFTLDPAHTVVGATARHLMVSKVRGKFTDVSGTITVAEDPLDSTAEVVIKAATIDTGVADRDAHLRNADFLDVENHPELTFRSTRVAKVEGNDFWLVGDLTIRGVTREVELEVAFEGVAKSPWGQEVIGFSATTELDREQFGMTWNAALETGGVLVSERIKLDFDISAIQSA